MRVDCNYGEFYCCVKYLFSIDSIDMCASASLEFMNDESFRKSYLSFVFIPLISYEYRVHLDVGKPRKFFNANEER